MKLVTFRIINCFGFVDSGEINLGSRHNLVYLLGRNSSGKSSLLNAIKYLDFNIKPSEQPNFRNFNDSGATPTLIAEYYLGKSVLSVDAFTKALDCKFTTLTIDATARRDNPKLETLFAAVVAGYTDLIENGINKTRKISVLKRPDGHYVFGKDPTKSAHREATISDAIKMAKHNDKGFNIKGSIINIPIGWNDFEDLLFGQFPRIYLFNERFSLREVLPERIGPKWEEQNNPFLTAFVEYLNRDDVNRYLRSNDPDERQAILTRLQLRLTALTDEVNKGRPDSGKMDLLTMDLHEKMGIQITVRTDHKKSYYAHLSDNTKFLFAYHLYRHTHKMDQDVLLFDEPNNGFHPTAQTFLLKFLKDLAAAGNSVIVATHSEYLIDLDYLEGVRLMSVDENNNTTVKNHFYNQAEGKGDHLALQPIMDAIGYRYGNQINIRDKVIVTEGVTDLLYLRGFNRILGYAEELSIAPARGDATILNVIPFLVSQGLNFKIVMDTGTVKQDLQRTFDIEDRFIFEIPIPAAFVGRMHGSGIEDLFSKSDFSKLLLALSHTPTTEFPHVSNSQYMKNHAPAKRLVAQQLYERSSSLSESDFDPVTVQCFRAVIDFCRNSDWYYL